MASSERAARRAELLLGTRIVVLSRRPGRIVLDLAVNLPRAGVDPDELRGSPHCAALRAQVGHAVKEAGAA